MNIFIDEYGTIFCEFKKGIYSPINNEYFEKLKKTEVIKLIEMVMAKNE